MAVLLIPGMAIPYPLVIVPVGLAPEIMFSNMPDKKVVMAGLLAEVPEY